MEDRKTFSTILMKIRNDREWLHQRIEALTEEQCARLLEDLNQVGVAYLRFLVTLQDKVLSPYNVVTNDTPVLPLNFSAVTGIERSAGIFPGESVGIARSESPPKVMIELSDDRSLTITNASNVAVHIIPPKHNSV